MLILLFQFQFKKLHYMFVKIVANFYHLSKQLKFKDGYFSCIFVEAVTFFANMDLMNHKINNP